MSKTITGIIIDANALLDLEEFCSALHTEKQVILQMVEHQLFIPQGNQPENWQFDSICLTRAKTAMSFYYDLDINLSGISLALELLERIEALETENMLLKKLIE